MNIPETRLVQNIPREELRKALFVHYSSLSQFLHLSEIIINVNIQDIQNIYFNEIFVLLLFRLEWANPYGGWDRMRGGRRSLLRQALGPDVAATHQNIT